MKAAHLVSRRLAVLFVIFSLGGLLSSAGRTAAAELPVTRVVLFSSGVGNFIHSGRITGDDVVTLHFSANQMNDVLKSMVVNDLDGGSVDGIIYPSKEPLTRALQRFAVDLSGNPPLAGLLKQIRGAAVRVWAPDLVAGRILSVERRLQKTTAAAGTSEFETFTLNLDTRNGLKAIPLSTISRLQLDNAKLNADLNRALEMLAGATDRTGKPVQIRFRGQGPRRVRIAYIIETPVWKTSYRLDMRDKDFFMQGWAIVENSSDSDWHNVHLVLVSGRPIFFIQDLYTPLYRSRPVVRPRDYAALRPRQYASGMPAPDTRIRSKAAVRKALQPAARMKYRRTLAGGVSDKLAAPAEKEVPPAMDSGVSSAVDTGTTGELFYFAVQQPVALARHQSALIPIVNRPIAAQRVSVYNRAVLPRHPLNGVWLRNNTGFTLAAGPVTVYAQGTYAGDARLGSLVPGDRRLLTYGVDLEVLVDAAVKTESRRAVLKIVDGILEEKHLSVFQYAYHMENKSPKPRRVVVEHPFNSRRKLTAPQHYAEKSARFYRFEKALAPGEKTTLTVREEQIRLQRLGLLDMTLAQLLVYSSNSEISPAVRKTFKTLATLKRTLLSLKAKRTDQNDRLQAISGDQDRLRKNIRTVGTASELGRRYLAKLSTQEDRIESIRDKITALDRQIAEKQNALKAYLENLSVE